MKIEVYLDDTKLDLSNVGLTNFRTQLIDKKERLAREEIMVPQFNLLTGDKDILQKAFLNQKAESLNL